MSALEEALYQITELERRLANMVTIGKVVEAEYNPPRCRVQIGDIKTGWLDWGVERAGLDQTWKPFEVDEQVLVFSPNGDLTQGIIVKSLYQTAHSAPANAVDITRTKFKDGTVIEHDRASSTYSLFIPAGGKFSVTVGGSTLEITDAGWTVNTPDVDWTVGG